MNEIDRITDEMIRKGAVAGRFRQCSLGWHLECSDPDGYDCQCPCHPIIKIALSEAESQGKLTL